ncbi:MAG TPA: aspartate aminotransferase family protein [Ilumatobacteraceae bacterium]|nr:aspartate aminotransferase family protein [Ilumatobacteraceae bacterium]
MTDRLDAQLAAAYERYAAKRPHSHALFEQACRVLPGGSTRSVLDFRPFSFRVARAEGSRLVDVDGHEYVDFLGDYSAGLLGHDPGPVAAAIHAALDRGWSFGATHVDEIRLAELVCQRYPSIDQVRFTNSGTEANLMALQLARHCTGRDRIAVFDGAYHGGLLYFGHGGEALQAPFDFLRLPYNDLHGVRAALDDTVDDVAALIVEPMMGAAGCIPAEPGFLAGLRDVCDRAGALLIFDEVMTSRMSAGGVQLRSGVHPDLTTLGKYLAGGMTFGAFGGRADLMAAFDPRRGGELTHGGTFNNNVVTMAGGVAALSELLTADVLGALFVRGEELRAKVATVLEGSTLPLSVSGMGSMFAIHPVDGPVRSPADLVGADQVLRELLFHHLVERGIFLAARGFVAMSLAIGDDDCDVFVGALADSVTTIEAAL